MKHRQAGGRATSAWLSGVGGEWQKSLEIMVGYEKTEQHMKTYGERLVHGVWVEGMYLVRIV